MVQLAANIWADGPAIDPYEPPKNDIRDWGTWIESIINAFVSSGGLIATSLTQLNGLLSPTVMTMAWVMGDPTITNNGIYQRRGDNFPPWFRVGDLPYSFIIASDVGAGTPNAIQATSSIPVSASSIVWVTLADTNGPGAVTISFNGATPLAVKTNSGNDPVNGGLLAGMTILGTRIGSTFRILSDQSSSAIVASAEAAKAAAETARDVAIAAASSVQSTMASRSFAVSNYHPAVAPDFIDTAGYANAGDGGDVRYKKVGSLTGNPVNMTITLSGGALAYYEGFDAKINPGMIGGISDGTIDAAAKIQAIVDYARTTYDNALQDFKVKVSLGGKIWRANTSINVTGIRQPDFTIENGAILGCCTGKAVIDLMGTNSPILRDVAVFGDKTNTPYIGIAHGRAKDGGGNIIDAPKCRMFQVRTSGYFNGLAILNFAGEVSSMIQCIVINKSRSLTAACYGLFSHNDSMGDTFGGWASDYITMVASADGAMSNIIHDLSQINFERNADVVIPIISISKANPAVVTVDAAALAASGLANTNPIFFADLNGMTQLQYTVQSVANINVGAGTFELSGVNSTSYSTFTSGNVWNRTGPAMYYNGAGIFSSRASYLLAYGSPAIVFDLKRGDMVRNIDIDAHIEPNTLTPIVFNVNSSGTVILASTKIRLLSSLGVTQQVFYKSDHGVIQFNGAHIDVGSIFTTPANGLFYGGLPAEWDFRGDTILIVPTVTLVPNNASFANPIKEIRARDGTYTPSWNAPVSVIGLVNATNDAAAASAGVAVGALYRNGSVIMTRVS